MRPPFCFQQDVIVNVVFLTFTISNPLQRHTQGNRRLPIGVADLLDPIQEDVAGLHGIHRFPGIPNAGRRAQKSDVLNSAVSAGFFSRRLT